MLRKIFLGFLILLTVSAVSGTDHLDQSTDGIDVQSSTTETITLNEVGGSVTVEYTVTKPLDDSDGDGSIQLLLFTEDGHLLSSGSDIVYENVGGGQTLESTFSNLDGTAVNTDNCGTNNLYMVVDDSYVNDYNTGEFNKNELFNGENGEDGNILDGQTSQFGSLTVEGGECASINKEPSADFGYAQGSSNIGAGTKIYLDASASSDPDGEIVEYRWDIEGKDDITTSSATGSSIKYTHPDPDRSISLTVEDDDGATATANKILDVKGTEYETESAGKYMYWVMNPSDPSKYYYWYLSNVRWGVDGLNPEQPGSLILQDFDKDPFIGSNQDETAVYRGGSGDIVGEQSYMDNNDKTRLSHLISTDGQSKSNPQTSTGDQNYDWCSEQNGQDTACHILEYDFTINPEGSVEGTTNTGIPDKLANADDIAEIGYIGGQPEYVNAPPGQLALGYAPNVFENKDMNGQKIFALCEQSTGANVDPNSDGMVIDMAPKTYNPDGSVDQQPDLYRCDSYSDQTSGWRGDLGGVWRPVTECNDGIDNDGDGGIDDSGAVDRPSGADPDNECNSPEDDTGEHISAGCTPVVTKTEASGIVANYGGSTVEGTEYCDGSGGNSETYSDWTSSLEGVSSGNVPEPQVITCFEFEDQNLNDEDSAYCEDRGYDNHDDDSNEPNSQVNFAKYYPTSSYYDEIINGEPVPTHFVDENGFTPARMALDDSGVSGDGSKPANRKGAENIYGSDTVGPHSDSYWLEDLGMVDEDGNGYTAGSYNDSWVVANAGAPDNPRVSSEFPGGYAGKCPEGTRWKFLQTEDRWQCSGQPDWKQAVFLPKIASGSDTIGMFVMPYNFRGVNTDANLDLRQNLRLTSWMTAYNEEADQQADSNQILDTMKVSCFPGETTPDYSSAAEGTDYFNKTVDIPGTDIDNPIGVYGEVDMGGLENLEYTCNWNYTTRNGELVTDVGRVIQLQKSTSDVVDNFQNVKGNYTGEDAKEFASGFKFENKDYERYDITKLVDRFKQREGWTVS